MNSDDLGFWEFYLANPLQLVIIGGIIVTCAVFGALYLRGTKTIKFRLEMFLRTAVNVFFTVAVIFFALQWRNVMGLSKDTAELSSVMDAGVPGMMRDLASSNIQSGVIAFVFAAVGWWLQIRSYARHRGHATTADFSVTTESPRLN